MAPKVTDRVKDVYYGKTLRKSYAKHDDDAIIEIPNLLKIQKDSYERFLAEGLNEVFKDVDTIKPPRMRTLIQILDIDPVAVLRFLGYSDAKIRSVGR